jgi:hypothetical protein
MAAIVDFEFAASRELLVHLHKIFKVASLALSNLTCKLSCQVKQTTSFLNISFLTCCITAPPLLRKGPRTMVYREHAVTYLLLHVLLLLF